MDKEISIYQSESGAIEVRLAQDTVWLTQAQMVSLFGRDQVCCFEAYWQYLQGR